MGHFLKHARLRLLGLALLTAAVLAAALWLPRPETPQQRYDKIKNGMTRAEVEGILGRPADEHTRVTKKAFDDYRERSPGGAEQIWPWEAAELTVDHWSGEDCRMSVFFDEEGKVADKQYVDRPPPTILDKLRSLLGW